MQPKTKLSQLKAAYNTGDIKKALSIAARFPQLGKEKDAIKIAHECYTNPAFYKQLGYNTAECIEAGRKALVSKYDLAS